MCYYCRVKFTQIYQSEQFNNFCKCIAGSDFEELKSEVAMVFYSMDKQKQDTYETKQWLDKWCRVVAFRCNLKMKETKPLPKVDTETVHTPIHDLALIKIEQDLKSKHRMLHAIVFKRSVEIGLKEYANRTKVSYNTLSKIKYEYKNYLKSWVQEKLQS
jgi:hypothetical protein